MNEDQTTTTEQPTESAVESTAASASVEAVPDTPEAQEREAKFSGKTPTDVKPTTRQGGDDDAAAARKDMSDYLANIDQLDMDDEDESQNFVDAALGEPQAAPPAEAPPVQKETQEGTPEAPPPPPAAEPPKTEEPKPAEAPSEAAPPEPTTQEQTQPPEPVAPPREPTPEEIAAAQAEYTRWRNEHEDKIARERYTLDPEVVETLDITPEAAHAVSKMQAKTYLDAVNTAVEAVHANLPRWVAEQSALQQQRQGVLNKLTDAWPQLKPHINSPELLRIATTYRQTYQDATPDDFIRDVGIMATTRFGLAVQPTPAASAPAPNVAHSAPFVPPRGTAAPMTRQSKPQMNPFEQLDNDFYGPGREEEELDLDR